MKTNCKKAIENIRNYIVDNTTSDSYGIEVESNFHDCATFIYDTFLKEKMKYDLRAKHGKYPEFFFFEEWCSGLPSSIDTCYYYNRSAVDDLAIILEETEEEKSKYDERKAEKLLTHLIYREIKKEVSKCSQM